MNFLDLEPMILSNDIQDFYLAVEILKNNGLKGYDLLEFCNNVLRPSNKWKCFYNCSNTIIRTSLKDFRVLPGI